MSDDADSRPGPAAVAARIGPIYTVDGLVRWLRLPDGRELDRQSVTAAATRRQLVAVRVDDSAWVFQAWQFTRRDSRLVLQEVVVALWQQLPFDGFLTDADLAAWMATAHVALGGTPADHAIRRGVHSPLVQSALSRLLARSS